MFTRLKERSEVSGVPQSRLVRDAIEFLLGEEPRTATEVVVREEAAKAVTPELLATPAARAAYADLVEREVGSGAAAGLRPFKCPAPLCSFEAGSEKARCPSHGRSVVPA